MQAPRGHKNPSVSHSPPPLVKPIFNSTRDITDVELVHTVLSRHPRFAIHTNRLGLAFWGDYTIEVFQESYGYDAIIGVCDTKKLTKLRKTTPEVLPTLWKEWSSCILIHGGGIVMLTGYHIRVKFNWLLPICGGTHQSTSFYRHRMNLDFYC